MYYLQSRYYDANIGRFVNADESIYATGIEDVIQHDLFAYCCNNPINNADPFGYAIETIFDVASIIWSLIDLINKPSWVNAGFLIWDVASLIPFVPGSYVAKGGKLCIKVADKISDFTKDAKFLTGTYSKLKKVFKRIKNVEIHHLVEKRFAKLFKNTKANDFLSVPLSKKLHNTITKRWRNLYKKSSTYKYFKYGSNYNKITYKQMEKAIKEVYKDMPQLLTETLNWFKKKWRK